MRLSIKLLSLAVSTFTMVGCGSELDKSSSSSNVVESWSDAQSTSSNYAVSSQMSTSSTAYSSAPGYISSSSLGQYTTVPVDWSSTPWLPSYYDVNLAIGNSQPLTFTPMATLLPSFKAAVKLGLAKTYPSFEFGLEDGTTIDLIEGNARDYFKDLNILKDDALPTYFPVKGQPDLKLASYQTEANGVTYSVYHSSAGNLEVRKRQEAQDGFEILANYVPANETRIAASALVIPEYAPMNGVMIGAAYEDDGWPYFGYVTYSGNATLDWIPDLAPIPGEQPLTSIVEASAAHVLEGGPFTYVVHRYKPWLKSLSYIEPSAKLSEELIRNHEVIESSNLQDFLPYSQNLAGCYTYSDLTAEQGVFDVLFLTVVDMERQSHSTQCFAGDFAKAYISNDGLFIKDASEQDKSWHFVNFMGEESGYQGILTEKDLPLEWPSYLDPSMDPLPPYGETHWDDSTSSSSAMEVEMPVSSTSSSSSDYSQEQREREEAREREIREEIEYWENIARNASTSASSVVASSSSSQDSL